MIIEYYLLLPPPPPPATTMTSGQCCEDMFCLGHDSNRVPSLIDVNTRQDCSCQSSAQDADNIVTLI